jgi:transcriptional regulator of acetoin/glycerol metabolism
MYKGLSAIPRKTTWLRRERGRFERADGGTIFLDKIWEILTTTRFLLLRVLQEKEFERAGGEDTLFVWSSNKKGANGKVPLAWSSRSI